MIPFIISEQLDNVFHHQHDLPYWLDAHRSAILEKPPVLPYFLQLLGNKSDKLENSSLLYRMKWIIAMAW